MIVISGALVLVALVLLVIGLVSTSLPFVYASIAVSVVSFVFLLIGILQRRGEQLPEPAAGEAGPPTSADVDGVTAIIPAGSRAAADPPAEPESESAQVQGNVLVVAGRPRYHVSGCRYLTGKDADEVDVQAARDEGFTACGVCKPDTVLAEEATAQPHPQPDEDVPAAEPVEETAEEPAVAAVPRPRGSRTAGAPDPVKAARKTTRATPTTAPGRTPATSTTQPAKKAAAKKAPAKTAAAKAPAKAPSKAAAAAAASTPAAASARRSGNVVVIPDRGKFHKADCRYVRDVPGAEELSKAAATRQGYDACGVCKP